MQEPTARYREFAPCAALRDSVRAFFTFASPVHKDVPRRVPTREILYRAGQAPGAPLFADAHMSIVFGFGSEYRIETLWERYCARPSGHVIGPMTVARHSELGAEIQQMGVYFRAAGARAFTRLPPCELADRIAPLDEVWGRAAFRMEEQLHASASDDDRVRVFEAGLLAQLLAPSRARLHRIAEEILRDGGTRPIADLAFAAGVSRQHLTRVFREEIGVTPKLYARLARFRTALAWPGKDWAQTAADLGYFDQSHLIADFRQFAGLTPAALARRSFHPFVKGERPPTTSENRRPAIPFVLP